jgi:pyruvate/2-oxoglutarate/acetoin dehydrogenase E1 component
MKQITEQLKQDGYEIEYFDLGTVEGLAEGAYHSVMATPTLLLVDEDDRELAEWRGVIPGLEEIKRECAVANPTPV